MKDNNPLAGATYLVRGLRVLGQPGIRRYVVAPLLINTGLFALGIYIAVTTIAGFIDGLLPDWLAWLEWLLWPLLGLVFLVIVFFTFSVLANIVAAPFNSFLAAAIERQQTGRQPQTDISVREEVVRTLSSEMSKLGYTMVRAVPLLLLMLIPGVNIIVTPVWLLFSAWMQSLQHVDYPMGNHAIVFADQRQLHAQRRWLSLGFGGAVTAATLIPVVNFIVMPAAVAGATLMWVERLQALPRSAPQS